MHCKNSLIPSMHIYMHQCIHSFWLCRNILWQYCQNCCNNNLHAKSIIATILPQCRGTITRDCCCNIVAIYCQKACISLRVVCLAHQIRLSEILPWDRKSFLTYQRKRDRVIPMLAHCRKNLSHIATHVR